MTTIRFEQRNPYQGDPPRPWVRLRLASLNGESLELDFLADTGNPFAVIMGPDNMTQCKHGDAPDANTNFGLLEGGWLQLNMPELGLVQPVLGYASLAGADASKLSWAECSGLVGLPLLRLLEYGGDSEAFWIRWVEKKP